MKDDWNYGERMVRLRERAAAVFTALESVKLSEFTVGQLDDLVKLVSGHADNEWVERLEKLVAERHRVFKHGMQVRYKKPKKGQKGIGIVTSHPRRGSRIVYVKGPRGWAGWTHVSELEIVS